VIGNKCFTNYQLLTSVQILASTNFSEIKSWDGIMGLLDAGTLHSGNVQGTYRMKQLSSDNQKEVQGTPLGRLEEIKRLNAG